MLLLSSSMDGFAQGLYPLQRLHFFVELCYNSRSHFLISRSRSRFNRIGLNMNIRTCFQASLLLPSCRKFNEARLFCTSVPIRRVSRLSKIQPKYFFQASPAGRGMHKHGGEMSRIEARGPWGRPKAELRCRLQLTTTACLPTRSPGQRISCYQPPPE